MQVGVPYSVCSAERVTTHLGTTVSLYLRDPQGSQALYYLYLPKRYAKVFTNQDIEDINADRVWLSLIYRRKDPGTRMHIVSVIECGKIKVLEH
jgi:hypothetical protein